MFDVFYIGENNTIAENVPFARKVDSEQQINAKTKMYWLIEPNVELVDYDVLEYRPPAYDQKYTHIWKWDSKNYGGLKLMPKKSSEGIKEINRVVCKKRFDVLPTPTPGDYFDKHPFATHVWCVDPEYKLNRSIDWAPDNFEPDFIHSFHLRGQLEYKYPEAEGGIKLFPKNWKSATVKYHKFLDAAESYPVLRVSDVEDYAQRDTFAEDYVWLIDQDHEIEESTLDWVPNPFEQDFIHSFRMPYQLQERYPDSLGGIRLVPKKWREAFELIHSGVIVHPDCPVEDANYDVFYTNKKFDAETFEFYAKRSETDWFWVVDRDYDFNGKLLYVPATYEKEYIHAFKWGLEHRYPEDILELWDERVAGIYLVHKDFDITKQKLHTDIVPVRYDIFFTDDMNNYEAFARKSRTDMFWLVDRDHQVSDVFTYVPPVYEQEFIHIFKLPGQLEDRYPREITNVSDNRCGGVKLVPVNYHKADVKYQDFTPVHVKHYPVIRTHDVDGTTDVEKDSWVIDSDYLIDDVIEWSPPLSQRNMIHTFHIEGQLAHKYPEAMGGVRWVPAIWNGDIVIHETISVGAPKFPIVFVKDFEEMPELTQDSWVIDEDYQISTTINWAPDVFEKNCIHTFQVKNQLEHKYPDQMGGVRWVPAEWNGEYVIHSADESPVTTRKYKVFFVDDPADYTQARGDCWLVDKEYVFSDEIEWVPTVFEKKFIHTFHVAGQLEHKYPEAMGGVRWVPKEWQDAEVSIHSESPFEKIVFEIFEDEEIGRSSSQHDWFWVVDPDVEVVTGFNFDFVPDVWDDGKEHVWQKLNPVTGRQFDYAGVRLCPKVPKGKGRPKYIREPACKQKPYDVFYMTAENGIVEQLESFDAQSKSKMYWAIDPYTRLAEDFNFDYYPSQWDEKNVHVFLSENERGDHKNVRLYPKGTFVGEHGHTEKSVYNNTFDNLKLMNTVASLPPRWPDVTLVDMTRDELVHHIKTYREKEVPFLWTIDVDVDAAHTVFERGFLPGTQNLHKVHLWQRVSPHTGLVHSYGGVRLWPTDIDLDLITTETVLQNKIKGIQYVREPGCYYKQYDVVLLTYHDADAEQKYEQLKEKVPHAKWVKDVDGIFEAHQAAARVAETKMFWVVDADAQIHEDFQFHYIPDQYDQDVVHVWNSVNPITGDVYGYGGVKLFNRQQVLDATSWGLDFTTGLSKRFKVVNEVSCITAFNTDAFSTWRSAFRETVKLAGKRDKDSKARLDRWLAPENMDADFAEEALRGAQQGAEYGEKYAQKPMRLAKINDYDWLREQYDNS